MTKQVSKIQPEVKQKYEQGPGLNWGDWQDQLRSRVNSADDLLKMLPGLVESPIFKRIYREESAFRAVVLRTQESFQFSATPYYVSLADLSDPYCPVLMQILPRIEEYTDDLFTDYDPLAEEKNQVAPGLTHRYPDRALWYLSHNCAVYCRFCMRKRKVSDAHSVPPSGSHASVLEYLRSHTEVKEVILSGGDPLSMSDEKLDEILEGLKSIDHLISIRIHSRMPVTLPQRITENLCKVLQKHYPLTFVTHFNHPNELTIESTDAVRRLRMAGVSVLNQSVLLKDVNDSLEIQSRLQTGLISVGIKPYYLHQCDEVKGVSHFRTEIADGLAIMRGLQGRIPGIAIPRYVIDLPGGGGKVPLENSYMIQSSEDGILFENWAGDHFNAKGDLS